MAKQPVNIRMNTEIITLLDDYAATHNTTRTSAIETLVILGLKADEAPRKEPSEVPDNSLQVQVELLRESNENLREQQSHLWAEIGRMAELARNAQNLADQAQTVHMAEIAKNLPPETARERFSRWMKH